MLGELKARMDEFTHVPSNIRLGVFRLWCLVSLVFMVGFGAFLIPAVLVSPPEASLPSYGLAFLLLVSFLTVPPLLLYLVVLSLMWVVDGFLQSSKKTP